MSVVLPKVEYSLTEMGKSLQPVIDAMKAWGTGILKEEPKIGMSSFCLTSRRMVCSSESKMTDPGLDEACPGFSVLCHVSYVFSFDG